MMCELCTFNFGDVECLDCDNYSTEQQFGINHEEKELFDSDEYLNFNIDKKKKYEDDIPLDEIGI